MTTHTETLHAADHPDTSDAYVTVTTEEAAAVLAANTREVTGCVLPWGKFGRTSNGPLQFLSLIHI